MRDDNMYEQNDDATTSPIKYTKGGDLSYEEDLNNQVDSPIFNWNLTTDDEETQSETNINRWMDEWMNNKSIEYITVEIDESRYSDDTNSRESYGPEHIYHTYSIPENKATEQKMTKCDSNTLCQCNCKYIEDSENMVCRCSCVCTHCCECHCTCKDAQDLKCPFHSEHSDSSVEV